jgi:hypothetical protein
MNIQEHLGFLTKLLRNEEPFHHLVRGRSWELKCFNCSVSADKHVLEKEGDEYSHGIFLPTVKKENRSWQYHLSNEDFHCTLQRGNMKLSDLAHLAPGEWLNDEVINGYIGLLAKIKSPDRLVLSGWFWSSVTEPNKSSTNKVKVVKNLVSICLTALDNCNSNCI